MKNGRLLERWVTLVRKLNQAAPTRAYVEVGKTRCGVDTFFSHTFSRNFGYLKRLAVLGSQH